MFKTKAIIFLAVIFALFSVPGQGVLVSAADDQPLYVVMVDRHALSGSQNNTNLTESFVGLTSTLRDGQQLAFINADNPSNILGPVESGSSEFKTIYKEFVTDISSSDGVAAFDLINPLAHVYGFLDLERAGAGSVIYLVTGGDSEVTQDLNTGRLDIVLDQYNAKQWSISGVSVPGSSANKKEFLNQVASKTGGDIFALSVPEGFKELSDSILRTEAKGTLSEIGQGTLAANEVLTSSLDIAPGTLQATLVFFRQSAQGSLRLKNPSGFEASEGDRTLSSVIETPFVVMWQLIDPAPGEWTVDVRGTEGQISAWNFTANKLGLEFLSHESVPFDQPVPLVAFVSDGVNKVQLEGIEIRASVTDPSGNTLVHNFNDNGELGDAAKGDGFYSTTTSPFGVQGDYQVQLELYWPEYDQSITSRETLSALPFPAVDVNVLQIDSLTIGKRVQIATAKINVNGQPYAISTNELSVDVSSTLADAGLLEVVPQRQVNQGQASGFDFFFTPVKEDLHTLSLRLELEYAGREYILNPDAIVLSSLIPAAPFVPVAAVVTEPTAPTPPAAVAPPQSLPIGLLAIPVVIVAGLLIALAYFLSRPHPYGYLYNDRGELLVDFNSLTRRGQVAFFSKNSVQGRELGLTELENVAFNFSKGRVDILSDRTEPTVRVNNRPLIEGERSILFNNSWIGTQGKLFSFLMSPMTIQAEPSVGDD